MHLWNLWVHYNQESHHLPLFLKIGTLLLLICKIALLIYLYPLWTEQWPLMKEKLQCCDSWGGKESDTTERLNWTELKERIDTQLELKHIEESCSPWNSPIFVIKKKSNKWHVLTDLRKVNASMKPMGALQPGIPLPTTIPQNWHIIITDLQDCFFNILLHSLDGERFAFSLLS